MSNNIENNTHRNIFINQLGWIEIIDQDLLNEFKNDQMQNFLNQNLLNVSCNGNGNCY
jgi:hypothetical protein